MNDSYQLGLVIKGHGILNVRGRALDLNDGDLFVVCRGDSFSVCSEDSDFEYCYILFRGRRADELMTRFGISLGGGVFGGFSSLADFWLGSISIAGKENVDLLCESVLLYSLALLRPTANEQSDLISKMVSLTAENFNRYDFNLIKLAAMIGYDEKYLSATFKKQKDITYSSYLRDLRLNHAVFLMERGLVSVKNIALLSGFSDPLYFSKVFKDREGISPRKYIDRISELNTTKGQI